MIETVILVLGITILLVLVSRLWRSPKQAKKEIKPNEARLYFFYTTWCGWSKKAQPEWDKVKAAIQAKPIFGTTKVDPIEVDAEQDRKLADLYEVEGYPTILLETSEGLSQYQKRVSSDGVLQFLRQSLGKERASL